MRHALQFNLIMGLPRCRTEVILQQNKIEGRRICHKILEYIDGFMLKSWWLYLGVSAGCLGATSAALGKCAGLYFDDRWGLRIFLYILMVLVRVFNGKRRDEVRR